MITDYHAGHNSLKPFLYYGQTEWGRLGAGVEYIGECYKYGLMLTVLWWFIIVGIETGAV